MISALVTIFLVLAGKGNALYSDTNQRLHEFTTTTTTIQTPLIKNDEDNALLPNLFYLDDHDRCLLQPGGLYCLGEFDLAPVGPSPTYESIKKYVTNNPRAFNRSRLYRGYCVSLRCPTTETNASLRFEQCVDKRARRHALSARLRKLQYCITQQQHAAKVQQPPDDAQRLFLQVVYAILALNFVGSVYDVATADDRKKNGLLMAWSLRASWRRLTAVYDDGDPRLRQLESIQGMRVVAMLLTIYAHTCIQIVWFYVSNANFMETLMNRADGIILINGTSLIQLFVMISSFLTSYNLLLYSEKHQLNFYMLPVLLVKRFIRIEPVHLLLVGFAATYWPAMRSGALSVVIGESSVACRRKFWAHAFFLNNIVEKYDNTCLGPTWFLPVDMHLFIVSSALTIIMYRRKDQALRLYAALYFISIVTCGIVAYIMGYEPVIYQCVPDKLRYIFTSKSFGGLYTSSWGSLPSCFVGLFLGHLHYKLQQEKYDWNQNKWFKRLHPWMMPLSIAVTLVLGMTFRQYTQPWVTAFYVTLEKFLTGCLLSCCLFGVINIDGGQRRFFGWRGWRVPARLSLPTMLCHWIVVVAITARPTAYYTSSFDLSIDYLATVFYGYLISLPVALLVEIPVQRFFAQFF